MLPFPVPLVPKLHLGMEAPSWKLSFLSHLLPFPSATWEREARWIERSVARWHIWRQSRDSSSIARGAPDPPYHQTRVIRQITIRLPTSLQSLVPAEPTAFASTL